MRRGSGRSINLSFSHRITGMQTAKIGTSLRGHNLGFTNFLKDRYYTDSSF